MNPFLLSLVSLFYFVSCEAKIISEQRIGAWHLWGYAYESSGTFSHCSLISVYNSGISLAFTVNRSFQWSMSLYSEQWSLTSGQSHELQFMIDTDSPQRLSGVAISPKLIGFNLSDSEELFNRFRKGRVLTLLAAGGRFQFNLSNSSTGLSETLKCTQKYKNYGVAGANPFVSPSLPSDARSSIAERRAEAATIIANTLSDLPSYAGYKILSREEGEKIIAGADVVWITSRNVGSVNVITSRGIGIEAMSSSLIQRDLNNCKGKFASSKSPPADETKVLFQILTYCSHENEIIETKYIIDPRKEGGMYIHSIISVQSTKNPSESKARI